MEGLTVAAKVAEMITEGGDVARAFVILISAILALSTSEKF
jgi:hypothetical protein